MGKFTAELMFGRPPSTPLDRQNPLSFGSPEEDEGNEEDNSAGFEKD